MPSGSKFGDLSPMLRKNESRTKLIYLFFMPSGIKFGSLLPKLRKVERKPNIFEFLRSYCSAIVALLLNKSGAVSEHILPSLL